uniref:Uncharacterized protein n=1 Tax=Cuerna arida TaxID=1464854 RepID=A0A1B6H2G7_9HEMI
MQEPHFSRQSTRKDMVQCCQGRGRPVLSVLGQAARGVNYLWEAGDSVILIAPHLLNGSVCIDVNNKLFACWQIENYKSEKYLPIQKYMLHVKCVDIIICAFFRRKKYFYIFFEGETYAKLILSAYTGDKELFLLM